MSSIPTAAVMEKERRTPVTVWGEEVSEYEMTVKVGDEELRLPRSPISVDGDNLEIESGLLDVGRVYEFEYLGTKMVLWKLPSGAIDLFEIIEE